MGINPSSDPNIADFFASSAAQKAVKIDTALKGHHLDFVYTIINRPECDKNTLKSVLKGCIDYNCSSLLAIEVIRKKVFENYEEKKEAIFAAAQKGESAIVEELVKIDMDQIELDPKDQEEAIKSVIQAYENLSDIDPTSLNRFLDIILILLKKSPVSDDTRTSIISLAIKAKYLALIEQLLNMPSAEDTRNKAVLEAIKCRNLDLAKALVTSGPVSEKTREIAFRYAWDSVDLEGALGILATGSISQEARGNAIVNAALHGFLPVIERLLEDGATISEKARVDAILNAAFHGFLAVIERLLKDGATISEEARGQAVRNAAYNGHLSVIERLLADGATISEKDRDDVAIEAAYGGHLAVIQALLANGATISEEARGKAVVKAALNGDLSVIEVLLANGATISEKDRDDVVIEAAYRGHLAIIERLLANGATISEEARGKAIVNAAKYGYLSVIERLLADGATISEELRVRAVIEAAYRGHLSVIDLLLANNEEARGNAIVNAAKYGYLSVIERLLADGATISEEARGNAIVNATYNGHLSVIERLLADGATISEEARGNAIVNAAINGHVSVIERLLADGATISEEARGLAVLNAAVNGHLSGIERLLANGATISEEARSLAINEARSGNHVSILTFLGVPLAGTLIVNQRLYVNRDQIKENPALCLSLVRDGFSGVTFLNPDGTAQEGIDAGGLTKQFIHELLDQLVVKEVIKLDDKRFPLCDVAANAESYKNLGKLLSVIDQKNIGRTDPIYIGPLFDPKVFDFFKDFLDPSLNEHQRIKQLVNILKNPHTEQLVDFLNIDEPTEAELNAFRTFMEEADFVEAGEYAAKTKEELRAMCCEKAFEPYIKAISLITSGFSDDLKAKILAQGAGYAEVLQGPETIDKEALVAKIKIKEDPYLSAGQRAEVVKKQDWIIEKITIELTADPKSLWVKKFLVCVTGQPVVPFSKIEIRGIEGVLCIAHTCFNQLDVPYISLAPSLADKTAEELEALGKERFFERLELAMATLDYGST